MKYVFDNWKNIFQRIKEVKHRLLLCDYDGTLAPIVDIPEQATMNNEMKRVIAALSSGHGITTGIISGRSLADIRQRVGLPGIIYAGNHGLEIDGPDIAFIHPLTNEIKSVIIVLGVVLKKTMNSIKGVLVEDKGLTLSVHYRLVEEDKFRHVNSLFNNTVDLARKLGKVKIQSGKKVLEVRPAVDWNKGKAVQLILDRCNSRSGRKQLLPIYVGDDLTDEDAFKAINPLGGITIYVGKEDDQSTASYYLNDTHEVGLFLTELLKSI